MTTVSRKPTAVWTVSAVPTKRWSAVSLSAVEKTPESAITAAPHTQRNATSSGTGARKKSGDSRQQVPLTARAAMAAGARPKRSEAQPPSRLPANPARPITTNAVRLTTVSTSVSAPVPLRLTATYAGTHARVSSHMWPK